MKQPKVSDMTANHEHDNPILVTGAAAAVGGIGRTLTELLLARGHKGTRHGSA
jgi:nucleoside-diphosphate-sugar epimerase